MTDYSTIRCQQCETVATVKDYPEFTNVSNTERRNIYWCGWLCNFCLSFQPDHVKKRHADMLKKLKSGYWKQDRLRELRPSALGRR